MSRLLLDANMPHGLRPLLSAHDVETAYHMGWGRLTNGHLLAAAEAGDFEIFITADRNIRYQQNLAGRQISIIELSTTHWETIRVNITSLAEAVKNSTPGSYLTVTLPKPPKRRRPFKPPIGP